MQLLILCVWRYYARKYEVSQDFSDYFDQVELDKKLKQQKEEDDDDEDE